MEDYDQPAKMNGLNGAAMNAPMVGLPTPAGHQAELNYIYGMVEELSRQLADNKRALEEVVSGVGRVRNRAKQLNVGNEEILASAVDEIAGTFPLPLLFQSPPYPPLSPHKLTVFFW